MKRLLVFLMLASIAGAQRDARAANEQVDRYSVSASTTAMTVQQPASATNAVYFETATVYCASASTVTPMWNSTTVATATTATIKRLPGTSTLPLATAWSGSNAASGTTGRVDNVPAGGTFVYDMKDFVLPRASSGGTKLNLTITTSNACTISFQWVEKAQ